MPTNTYDELQKITVGTATNSITFTNINQGYTDLVIVTDAGASVVCEVDLRVGNSSVDTGSNYSRTVVSGSGSAASSARNSNQTYWRPNFNSVYDDANGKANHIFHFMNYSNTTTNKTMLYRGNSSAYGVDASVCLWRSTAAINTITLYASITSNRNFLVGSTFSLYGIAASSVGAKATGGDIYTDSQYYYHVFDSSGTFTPTQSLTAEVLVVAGGGGGAGYGAGGAGGLSYHSGKSLTATNYTVTVGAGGASAGSSGVAQGGNGVNSVFDNITSNGGGGGRTTNPGVAGGSGGGGGYNNQPGGAATQGNTGGATGYGNAGGAGYTDNLNIFNGGAGGGAGASPAAASTTPVTGGIGLNTWSAWAAATGTGVSGYYAGGGSGNSRQVGGNGAATLGGGGRGGNRNNLPDTGGNGVANTGGGGGAGDDTQGGNGGSGIVIVRYLKA